MALPSQRGLFSEIIAVIKKTQPAIFNCRIDSPNANHPQREGTVTNVIVLVQILLELGPNLGPSSTVPDFLMLDRFFWKEWVLNSLAFKYFLSQRHNWLALGLVA